MDAITGLLTGQGTPTTMLYLSLTAFLGVLLGKLEIKKIIQNVKTYVKEDGVGGVFVGSFDECERYIAIRFLRRIK